VLALAPFFAWPILFLTLPVLVWLMDSPAPADRPAGRAARLHAAGAGWWFGFGYFFFGLFWIGEAFLVEADKFAWLLPFAVTMMPAGLALFYAAATAAAVAVSRPGLQRIIALAVTLGSAEWLRGHVLTGFPWNVLGYALTWPLPLMQTAGLVGIYGLTLWAVVIFATPLVLLANRQQRPRAIRTSLMLALAPLLLMSAYGLVVLAVTAPAPAQATRVRIVQPSVPQWEKWQPQNQRAIFDLHLDLSRRNPQGEVVGVDDVDLLVWPEAAMPFFPLEQPQALSDIRSLLGPKARLVTGGLRRAPATAADPVSPPKIDYFNSLMIIGRADEPTRVYDKIHLVPFGEYLPQQATLEAIGLEQLTRLRGGFTPGPSPRPLLDGIGPLICYEAIFPAAVVQGAERPRVFVNLTNDGWFGNTTGPRQHLHQARVRAVEEGIPIVRAANNGISALIDSKGRLLAELGLNEKGVLDALLPAPGAMPPYGRYGDTLFLLNLLIFALWWLYVRGRTARSHG
jgi:apolipoprotein N-acyltransferase